MSEVTRSKLSILENNSCEYYRSGLESLGSKNILLGISPGNGFFSEENLLEILLYICSIAPKVYIVVPDAPHIHNFIGMGYAPNKAEKKTKKENKQTVSRLQKTIDVLKTAYNVSNFAIIDWQSEIENHPVYQKNYRLILDEYHNNSDFQHDINTLSYQYLQSRTQNRTIEQIVVKEGVKYYLKELALFSAMPHLFGESPIVGYYKQWKEGLRYIKALFDGFSEDFGLIQYQLNT